MSKAGMIVTGDRTVDRNLARMEKKAINKLLPKAAKEAAEISREDFRATVPVKSGAMRDSAIIRVRRYKHKADTGKTVIARGGYMAGKRINVKRVVAQDIGARVMIDRKTLAKKAGQKRRGAKSLPIDRKRGGMFFYPSLVELGNSKAKGDRPLTRSLYGNEAPIRQKFIASMRRLTSGF